MFGTVELLIVLAMVIVIAIYFGVFVGLRRLLNRRHRKDPA